VSDCEFFLRPDGPDSMIDPTGAGVPAFFLDRDNTLVPDHGYVHRPEELELLPGVDAALMRMRDAGWRIFVVTNQAGVAKGRFALDDAWAFNEALVSEVWRDGVRIDEIRFCPHHPDGTVAEYRKHCESRKPRPGMLLEMARTWGIDPSRAVMIGDQATDVEAGVAAGMSGLLATPGGLGPIVDRVLFEDERSTYLGDENRAH